MAKIKSTLKDVGKVPMITGTARIFSASKLRPGTGSEMTTDGVVNEKITNGTFLSRDLLPGHAKIEFISSTKRYGPYDINIPTGTAEFEVSDLIAQYIVEPPLVVSQVASLTAEAKAAAVAAAQSAAAAAANGGGTTVPPLVADTSREGFFTIPAGSSVREDPARPGVFLIGG